ncbi:DNA methyltransferase, partial [Armatimonas sp.]|uniref:DNA methyltransferase n=1 Tax=Armatimonas sp. TaxID=1872638 RepID=UPI00375328B2
MSTSAYTQFRELLDEIFQFDRADLDFGIYRILNQKRVEVQGFFDNELLPQVDKALAGMQQVDTIRLQKELEEVQQQMHSYQMSPAAIAAVPRVRELRAKLDGAVKESIGPEDVFSALTEFFRRYYDKGDFLSRPLYRKGVYAVPYEGQEVKLHFANSDQYYIKTGEHFKDYAFTLDDGRGVHFAITEASTERDNNKAQGGKDRCFVLCTSEDAILADDTALTLRFSYTVPEQIVDPETGKEKKRKQEDLNAEAVAKVLADLSAGAFAEALGMLKPTEKNPKRTLLEAKLSDYTARNKFDYFIHKDLGGFLRRELDFYIKSEVVPLDDLTQTDIERLEKTLKKVRAIREVAETLIAFLAQLEEFQKRVFLKKKFVIETGWCVTLDRVPLELWEEVAKNTAQVEEWKRLYAIHEHTPTTTQSTPWSEPPSVAFLTEHPHLMVDTQFFGQEFTECLLASWEDIEAQTDGVIVNSENLQALNLLKARYAGEVKCIYIDPPYNTGGDGFLYKDSYQHSSWLAMMQDRLITGRSLLNQEGTIFVSIDNHESGNLINLMDSTFGNENFVADLVWEKTRKNDAKLFSVGHEYMFCYAKDMQFLKNNQTVWRETKPGAQEIIDKYQELRIKHKKDNIAIQEDLREWYKILPLKHPSKSLSRYKWVDDNGPWRDRDISWPGGGGPRYKVNNHPTGASSGVFVRRLRPESRSHRRSGHPKRCP